MSDYSVLIPAIAEILNINPTWDNEQIATKLNQKDITAVISGQTMIRYRTLVSTYGPEFADGVLDALEAAAPSNKTIKRILPSILNDGDFSGVDVSNTIVRQILDQFVTVGLFTQDQTNKIKAMGEYKVSLAEQAGFTDVVGAGHVKAARDVLRL